MKKILKNLTLIGVGFVPIVTMVSCGKENKQKIDAEITKELKQVTSQRINNKLNNLVNHVVKASTIKPFPSLKIDNNILATFTSWEHNDVLGHIKWSAKISKKNGETQIINGKLDGFQTQVQRDNESKRQDTILIKQTNVANINNQLVSLKSNSWLASTVKKPENIVNPNGVTATFNSWNANDNEGKISWQAVLSKGMGDSKTISGEWTGFQTKVQKEAIETQNNSKLIQTITEDNVNIELSKLALKINQSSLFINPISVLVEGRVTATFENWTPNDTNGKIIWKAILTKGNAAPVKISGELTGFQTTADLAEIQKVSDQSEINNLNVNNINNELLKIKSSIILASKMIDPVVLTLPNGVNVEFILWDQNDVKGEILWKANISKGEAEAKELEGILTGFENNNQRIVNNLTANQINVKLNFEKGKLPSEINKPQTIKTDKGTKVDFTWGAINDDLGTISWSAQLSMDKATSKSLSGSIVGLQTTAERAPLVGFINGVNAYLKSNPIEIPGLEIKDTVPKNTEKPVYDSIWAAEDITSTIQKYFSSSKSNDLSEVNSIFSKMLKLPPEWEPMVDTWGKNKIIANPVDGIIYIKDNKVFVKMKLKHLSGYIGNIEMVFKPK